MIRVLFLPAQFVYTDDIYGRKTREGAKGKNNIWDAPYSMQAATTCLKSTLHERSTRPSRSWTP